MTTEAPVAHQEPHIEERTALATRFCRVVAIIDDEIEDTAKPGVFTDQFSALRKNLDDSAIVCHLHHYATFAVASTDPNALAAIERAYRLACAADLVIIDWHLGLKEDYTFALSIIKKLVAESGIRFVLINTKADLKEAAKAIKDTFQAEEIDDGTAAMKRFKINENFFVSIRQKPMTAVADDANKLLKEAHDWLVSSFPDHLHWAGLEMAVRVREMLPKVIAAMPKGTNAALLHQLLYQRRPDEIAMQITEVFLDDLRMHFGQNPLRTASDMVLFDSMKSAMAKLIADEAKLKGVHDGLMPDWQTAAAAASEKAKSRSDAFKKLAKKNVERPPEETAALEEVVKNTVPTPEDEALKGFGKRFSDIGTVWPDSSLAKIRLNLPKYFPGLASFSDSQVIAAYLNAAFGSEGHKSMISWASLKEGTNLPLTEHGSLFPGCVLHRSSESEEHEYLLCITPACDCYNGGKKGYLFIAGQAQSPKQSSLSITQMWFKDVNIAWNAESLVAKKPTTSPDNPITNYTLEGAVRSQFTARIIQRVWAYQSRVGVDTSEFYRLIRDE